MVALAFDDVTSGLGRPLAVGIDKPLLKTNEKSHITSERYTVHLKLLLNSKMKPWSLYRQVTSLPVSDINDLVKWHER
jgi:hypothetical protein